MAGQWFIREHGKVTGPILSPELREAARRGKITPDTLVRRVESKKWCRAKQVKGLFPAPPKHSDPARTGRPLSPDPAPPEPANREEGASETPPAEPEPAEQDKRPLRKRLLRHVLIWSPVPAMVLAGVWLLNLQAESFLTEQIAYTNEWLEGKHDDEPEWIEGRLESAMGGWFVFRKAQGQEMLKRLREQATSAGSEAEAVARLEQMPDAEFAKLESETVCRDFGNPHLNAARTAFFRKHVSAVSRRRLQRRQAQQRRDRLELARRKAEKERHRQQEQRRRQADSPQLSADKQTLSKDQREIRDS